MDQKMEEVLSLAAELAQEYAGYESSSVTYERAQTLMEAVLYHIDEYRRHSETGIVPGDISVKEQYDAGRRLVLEKAEAIRDIMNEMSVGFEDFGVRCLHDTVQKGIPEFLKWYDVKFCPQDTILTLDYPLLADHSSLRGADAVYQYMRAIQIEQLFLGAFEKQYIVSVLRKYDTEYREMVENICGVVMTDMVGHMAIGKPFRSGGFSEEEYLQLAEVFGGKPADMIKDIVRGFIRKIVSRYYDDHADMAEYLCGGAEDIAVRIDAAVQYGGFDKIL